MEERKNILQNNVGIIPSRSENEIRCGLFLYVYNLSGYNFGRVIL